MNAASVFSGMVLDRRAILAIIRKDLRTLWPLALAVAVLQLVMIALFRAPDDYPNVMLDFGASQLHLAPVMLLFQAFGLPILVAVFVVLLVQQDSAADARNDWMVRPIAALDIVSAKASVILAVVLIPSTLGNFIYVTTHDQMTIAAAIGPILLTLIGCIFMLVVAWLASGPVQALAAPLVLAIATLVAILSFGLTIGISAVNPEPRLDVAAEVPLAAPATPEGAAPTPAAREAAARRAIAATSGSRSRAVDPRGNERARVVDLTWPIVITELLLMLGAAGVVLWLLLVRRRLHAARLAFLGFFGAAVVLMLLQGAVSTPRDEMIALRNVTSTLRPSPPLAERLAAFAKHDADKDGRLDRWEYRAVLEELGFSNQYDSLWLQRDDNMDGFISAEEYTPAIPAAPGGPPAPDPQRFAAFTRNDANKDRRLDRAEYQAVLNDLGFAGQFDTLWAQRDGNRDGFVSAEEYGLPAPAAEAPPQ